MANGRGAWNNQGLGGTKKYKDATKPGPYYFTGSGKNIDVTDPNQYAVRGAVIAYQKALNLEHDYNLAADGWYGDKTTQAVLEVQRSGEIPNTSPWGGVGPDTSKFLLYPQLRRVHRRRAKDYVPLEIVSGTIRHESNWDAGAVGYIDPRDVGLGQINSSAHPEWDVDERLTPVTTYRFIIDRYNADIPYFKGNVRDAVAAYNLGRGGANSWIKAGRPDVWTPAGSNTPRDVKGYIDSILKG